MSKPTTNHVLIEWEARLAHAKSTGTGHTVVHKESIEDLVHYLKVVENNDPDGVAVWRTRLHQSERGAERLSKMVRNTMKRSWKYQRENQQLRLRVAELEAQLEAEHATS